MHGLEWNLPGAVWRRGWEDMFVVLESQLAETNWVLEDCCCSEMSEAAQRLTVPARLAVPVAGRWPVIGYVLLAGRERRSFGGV